MTHPLVESARKYLGTKFVHQGRTPHGLDCVGLGMKAFRDCGVILKDFRGYGQEPNKGSLVAAIVDVLGEPHAVGPVKRGQLQAGDIIVLRYSIEPHHIAIVSDYPYGDGLGIIHADGWTQVVTEHRLSDDMIKRITHMFRKPV